MEEGKKMWQVVYDPMEASREVKVRYLVHFDNEWNLLRIVHERDIATEDIDTPEGVWMLDGGNFGQDDFMGIGITVDIYVTESASQILVSHDLILREADRVFRRWVLGFYETTKKAIDKALEEALK